MRKDILWGKLIKVIIQKTEISDTKLNANKTFSYCELGRDGLVLYQLEEFCINGAEHSGSNITEFGYILTYVSKH
jgi:hypothetical protein